MQLTIKNRPAYKKQQISIRIDKDILDQVNELSLGSGYSRSEIINVALRATIFKIEVEKGKSV